MPVHADTGTPSHRACIQSSRERPANGARDSDFILNANGSLIKVQKARVLLSCRPTYPPLDPAQAAASAPEDTTIDCGPPTVAEVDKAIGRLKAGKAPGICGIPAELLMKAGGYHTAQWLTKVFHAVWQYGQMPSDWKKGIILPL